MAIPLYLAMTAAEFSYAAAMPERLAWMACHFSPGGNGLVNLPKALPPGSLLILDDQMPPSEHDADLILRQLSNVIEENACSGLLLDFQRPSDPRTLALVKKLLSIPCTVCVSHLYAIEPDCPVFLPPCPPEVPLSEYLSPWDGRKIWMEAATDTTAIAVTEKGSQLSPLPSCGDFPQEDKQLHCHYRIETNQNEARFFLHRTREDLTALLEEADTYGVQCAVGLWQELGG